MTHKLDLEYTQSNCEERHFLISILKYMNPWRMFITCIKF